RQHCFRRAARADQADTLGFKTGDDRLVRVEPEDTTLAEDERVHGGPLRLVAELGNCLLVRSRDVRARETERDEAANRGLEALRHHLASDIGPIERACSEGGVLHPWR